MQDLPNKNNETNRRKPPLSVRIDELLKDRRGPLPIWIRSPKLGPEYYSGFSRAKLYDGAAKGLFRSVSIREPGQLKGTRLFHLESILDFIASFENSPNTRPTRAAEQDPPPVESAHRGEMKEVLK